MLYVTRCNLHTLGGKYAGRYNGEPLNGRLADSWPLSFSEKDFNPGFRQEKVRAG